MKGTGVEMVNEDLHLQSLQAELACGILWTGPCSSDVEGSSSLLEAVVL